MAIDQGQKSVQTRNVKDTELILMASSTVTTSGGAKTSTPIAIQAHHWYTLCLMLTDIDATGDDAAVTFELKTGEAAAMTYYESQFAKTVSQAAGTSPTGTLITDAMLPLPYYMAFNAGKHTYAEVTVTVTGTGGTITAEAWLVPME
jgi:hypothetical protein